MSQVLGDYNSGVMGNYNIEAEDTRNQWLPNGSSYITSPTLGNLLIVDQIFVEIEDCLIDLDVSPVSHAIVGQSSVSQAGGGSREFEITAYNAGAGSNGILLYLGSVIPNEILSRAQIISEYGGPFITGKLSVRTLPIAETFEVYRDDVLINSGPLSVVGGIRIDGTLFRVGAESEGNGNPPNTGGEHTAPAGWRIGNVSVSLDTGAGLTKVRELAMPIGTATNVPDIVGNNDGTLREGTGDGSDWAIVPNTEKPVITLLGVTPVDHKINTPYVDAGATAEDQKDGDITGSIVTVSDVNTGVSGVYSVTYNVANSDGINADEVVRTVSVSGVESISFTPVFGAALATLTESNVVTLTGSGGPFPISVSNGEYRINGGSYTAASGSVNIGDTIQQRVTSSASYSTPVISSVNVDGVIGTFTVITTFNPSLTASGEARLSLRLGLGL